MKKVFFISMFMFFSLGYSDMNMEIFNKNRENDIRRRYSHIGALGDELSQDPTLNNRNPDGSIADERPINFGGDANSDLFSAFSEFARKYDEIGENND